MFNTELNSNKSKIDDDFDNVYEPLVKEFMQRIEGVRKNNLPEPFIPVYGKNYADAKYKIAFIGWETRDNSSLEKFCKDAIEDSKKPLRRFFEDIYAGEEMTIYGNNFGTSFWDFIIKYLANFYCEDWEKLKYEANSDILKSFVWGNLESIERFEVTAKVKGADIQDWRKVKQASLIFDNADNIIKSLHPKVLIILHWDEEDSWLSKKNDDSHEIIIEDVLEYYHLKNADTHVYWTRHPGSLSRSKIDFNKVIINIIRSISDKRIYDYFPGQQILRLIDKFYLKIEEVGSSLGLKVEIQQFYNQKACIYFRHPNWKYCKIGFEFEDYLGNSFFGGIRRFDENVQIPCAKSISQKLEMKEDPTDYWPYWFWFDEEYKNWINKLYDEPGNESFAREIKMQVERMRDKLIELECEGLIL